LVSKNKCEMYFVGRVCVFQLSMVSLEIFCKIQVLQL
jgi:hypothetical protein